MGEPRLEPPYTASEVAVLLGVSEWVVGQMCRKGYLPRIPGLKAIKVPRAAVHAMLDGAYHASDAKSNGQAAPEAASSWRVNRRPPDGPLAGEAMGGGGPLSRRVGPAAGDVVVRRVER